MQRDIVVMGASSGGQAALLEIVANLPASFLGSVFVVMHMAARHQTQIDELLSARGPLRATLALHGESIESGRIYVAPPDNHLLIREGYIRVVRGPKENGHRPSVDAMFRSASNAYGPRVIGVVLTGELDCGTAGLISIRARGGIGVVQEPATARAPSMPTSAILHSSPEYVVPLGDIASTLARLTMEQVAPRRGEVHRAVMELEGDEPGSVGEIVCPHCQGAMRVTDINGYEQFRCHVGHTFSLDNLELEQTEHTERALWAAVRALEETAAVAGRIAARTNGVMKARFEDKRAVQLQQADLIKKLIFADNEPTSRLG